MDARGNALNTLTTDYLKEDPEPEDSELDEDGDEYSATKSDEEIVDETLHQYLINNHTRSKYQKEVLPEPLPTSDSEDEGPRQQPYKRNRGNPAPLTAGGYTRYFRLNSNLFPIIASKKLADSKRKAGGRGSSDQLKTARQETTRR